MGVLMKGADGLGDGGGFNDREPLTLQDDADRLARRAVVLHD